MSAFASAVAVRPPHTQRRSCNPIRSKRYVIRRARPRACAAEPTESSTSTPSQTPTTAPLMSTAACTSSTLSAALQDAASRALAGLRGATPDVALVFVSARLGVTRVGPRGRESLGVVVPKLRALMPNLRAVVGCGADSLITDENMADDPGVSLTLLSLPNIKVRSLHVMPDDMPSVDNRTAWARLLGLTNDTPNASPPSFIVLSDPTFSARGDLDKFLTGVHNCDNRIRVAGAQASTGASGVDGHMLCTLPRDVLDPSSSALRDSGLVALALEGDVELEPMVASRVRPVGPVFTATSTKFGGPLPDLHIVGQPTTKMSALTHLRSVINYATLEERRLIKAELHIGVADPDVAGEVGAYVIRNVGSVDVDAGVIATPGADVLVGQSVRFFVKDVEAAATALDGIMQKYKRKELAKSLVGYANPPFAALVFSDVSRAMARFKEVESEGKTVKGYLSGVPIAGFVSDAQIAPTGVGEKSGVVGDTATQKSVLQNAVAVVVLLRRRNNMSSGNTNDGV